jgi:hypothetical protein
MPSSTLDSGRSTASLQRLQPHFTESGWLASKIHVDIFRGNHNYGYMKTTLTISDDLFRQAKAYAALRGQTFGNLIEQSLRKVLLDSPSSRDSSKHWVQDLPRLSTSAAADLDVAVNIPDFRTVETEMWK